MSEHFDIQELNPHGFELPPGIEANLECIAANFLEQVRAVVDRPVHVTSGYRSPVFNRRIGGSKNSRHMYGLAADVTWDGIDDHSVTKVRDRLMRELGEVFAFQLIWYPDRRFIHIGLAYPSKGTEFLTL